MTKTTSLASRNSNILLVFFEEGVLTSCLFKDGTRMAFGTNFVKKHRAIEWNEHDRRNYDSFDEYGRWLRKHRMKKHHAGYGYRKFEDIPLEVLV